MRPPKTKRTTPSNWPMLADPATDLVALEKDKIKGAIRTDFVLSAEIIVIALGTVADKPFGTQVAVLSGIGLLMTVGVYGLVAAIVKLDDAGAWLLERGGRLQASLGAPCCWRRRS
jgi:predicted DNA repair protein MutK